MRKRRVSHKKRYFSIAISLILLTYALLNVAIPIPNATAAINHDIGNVEINMLSDFGRILGPISWNGFQTTRDPTGLSFIGLVIDQANYDHTSGFEDIADSFSTYPYLGADDLTIVDTITFAINNGMTQKSIASFQNTGVGTLDPNDILINQKCWTVLNKDWAILQWTLSNVKTPPSTLSNVCIGLELPLSQVGASGGLGGDNGDDIDGFDSVDNIYWAQDDGGTGDCIGFASAIGLDPITHYYSEDCQSATYDDYKVLWEDDTWLYQRIHASNSTVGPISGNRTSTVGWNDINLGIGSSRTFTLVIAVNDTFNNMKTAIKDAQYYYQNVASGFQITEIRDSGSASARVEIFNNGRKPLLNPDTLLTLTSTSGTLTGSWSNDPIPTYGYSYLDVSGGTIDAEGDTITLEENSIPVDQVAFGQEGVAPDPLDGESVARRYDVGTANYTNEWIRNASTGPTFNTQNDVGDVISSPNVVLNRMMFNPFDPVEGYVELIYIGAPLGQVDISGYKIVCDDEFIIPSGYVLNATNKFYTVNQSNYPVNFDLDDGSVNGDNVYLYDNNGNLMDMVGWSSQHTQGRFMSRSPDGSGTYQGYDDATSQASNWIFDQLPSILITEFSADDINTARIEIYNPRGGDKVLSTEWSFDVENGGLNGNWNTEPLPNRCYTYFDRNSGATIKPEGDTIRLYYSGSFLRDETSFGLKGIAPDPIVGESTARYWNNSILGYTDNWTRNTSFGQTWGAQNDVSIIGTPPEVVLNRVMFNPMDPVEGYVELMYKGSGTIDISGYKIICDDEFTISSGTELNDTNYIYTLIKSDYPLNFDLDDGSINGDNVYLYDNNGNLLDMVGWSSSHTQGYFMSRVPDGTGTHQGYDDITSPAAGWVFDQLPSILITEFYVDILSAQIEVYNPRGGDKVLDPHWTLTVDSGPLTGAWLPTTISRGAYSIYTMATGTPGEEGDTIRLFYKGSILRDDVPFGTNGMAPDPLVGESTARYWNSSALGYNNDWTRAFSTSFGFQNDVSPNDFNSRMKLNEILFNPIMSEDGFVELYHKWGGVNISGYKIVGDKEYIIPIGSELEPYGLFFYLQQPTDQNFFNLLNPSGDNVYLYDNNDRLLDMVGWSSPHLQGESMCRIPNGYGARDGYDDASSIAAGWIFGSTPTVHLVRIWCKTPINYGNFNSMIYYNMTITNYQFVNDTINIFNSTLNGYPVIFLDETQSYIISEIYMPARSSVNISVMVILPSIIPFIEWDNITFWIRSQNESMYMDEMLLQAFVQGPVNAGPDQTVYESDVVQFSGGGSPKKSYPVWPVDISGNGQYMAIGWDNNVTFFSTATNLPLWTYDTGGRVGDLKLTDDGRNLVVGSYETVYFFDTISSNPLWSINIGDSNARYDAYPGNRLDMTRDGKYIAAVAAGNYTHVYDTTSSTPTALYWRYKYFWDHIVYSVKFSGDGRYLSIGDDFFFRLAWIPGKNINWTSGHMGPNVYSSSLSYTGHLISSGSEGQDDVHLYSYLTGDGLWEYWLYGSIYEQVMSDDGAYFVSTNMDDYSNAWNGFAFWNTSNKNPIWTYVTGGRTEAVDMDRNANYVVGGCRDNNIYLFSQLYDGTRGWNNSDGTPIYTYPTGGMVRFNSVSISGDGTYFASGSWDGNVYLFSTLGGPHPVWKWRTNVLTGNQGPFNYSWDFNHLVDSDGDSNFTNDVDATGPKPTHIYGDDGVYTVTLTVTDGFGVQEIDTCDITVDNVAPTIEPFGPFIADEGVPLTFTANATDLGSDDLTFTWDWGDGTSDNITIYYNDGIAADPYPSPGGNFPFAASDTAQHSYTNSGVYTINLTVEDDDGGVTVYTTTIVVGTVSVLTPTLYINISQDGKDVILSWDPPTTSDIAYYLIYRSPSQTDFDFNSVWKNTSYHKEPGESTPIPLRTMWNDTNAAYPGDITNYREQYYYTIRVVDNNGEVSRTSRTVGKWTKTFQQGISTFSLPLEPLQNLTIDHCLSDMNARYIEWMHQGLREWMKHGDGVVNDTQMKLGEGYIVKFDGQTDYTFTGMPGAMIVYEDSGFLGFDTTEAKSLVVSVDPSGNIDLSWLEPLSMSDGRYEVYYSNTRDGFFGTPGIHYKPACPAINFGTNTTTITGLGAEIPGSRLYIMVVPFNTSGVRGASTYSIGIWTEEYIPGYDTFGIPLKLDSNQSADWYCDNIPNTVGINYFIQSKQWWGWHSTRMPAEAYDPILVMTEGYQISTSNATKFIFIGV